MKILVASVAGLAGFAAPDRLFGFALKKHVVRLLLAMGPLACSSAPRINGTNKGALSASLDANQATDEPFAPMSDGTMSVISLRDALGRSFRPLHPELPDGPRIAVLRGDPEQGPSFTLFRYGPDYTGSGRLHTHSAGYQSWLIEGAMKHWGPEGDQESAPVLAPGSYWSQPAGELHADNCVAEQCTAYVVFDGPIDADFPDAH